ncbi:MAG: ArsR family transcriptional regulator [Gemmatimonadetes bacterium]|nr:MAG: ArsR family transcriptional regulator [Gemmatimonadota bacterium]
MRHITKLFKALSDPNRLRILKMLETKPLCVCEITTVLNLAPSTVSKHLSILRDTGLITDEKDGKWVNYSLTTNPTDAYVAEILPLIRHWLNEDDTIRQDRSHAAGADRMMICC